MPTCRVQLAVQVRGTVVGNNIYVNALDRSCRTVTCVSSQAQQQLRAPYGAHDWMFVCIDDLMCTSWCPRYAWAAGATYVVHTACSCKHCTHMGMEAGAWPYAKERWALLRDPAGWGLGGTWGWCLRWRAAVGGGGGGAPGYGHGQQRDMYESNTASFIWLFDAGGRPAGRRGRGGGNSAGAPPRAIAAPKAGGSDCPAGPGPRGLLSPAVSIALSADDHHHRAARRAGAARRLRAVQ